MFQSADYKLGLARSAVLAALALSSTVSIAQPLLDPLRVIQAKFDAVNRHDIAAIVAAYADEAVLNAPDFCAPRRGKADVERTYRAIFAAVPDIRATVDEAVVQGNRVAVRVLLRSDAPGRSFTLPLFNFFTVSNGRIVRDEGQFDNRGRACKA